MPLPLIVRNLTVTSDRERRLLSVPHLDVPPGTSLGIRGPSGAGKSTLLYALAGLLETAKGEIAWGETALLGLSMEQRATFRSNHIGLIFQDFLLFDELSAAANASLPAMYLPKHQRRALRDTANTQLAHLGLQEIHRRVDSFSGGERQRVAVARALSNDTDVLLADEPTASLDRTAADRLIKDLTALTRQTEKTLIAVSHDAHLLDHMDRVITVADGQVSIEGPAT